MRKRDFYYPLPEALIAQHPLKERTASRLLILEKSGEILDRNFKDLIDQFNPGDLLVFNDTRVIPARLFGRKASGGQVEILIERILDETRILAHTRSNKALRPGIRIEIQPNAAFCTLERLGDLWTLNYEGAASIEELLECAGHIPLPPYIQRADKITDRQRYQTVYAQKPGAVAAPTAGLHFDEALIRQIQDKGLTTATVTLHVGSATFQPIRVEDLAEHHMHSERYEVKPELVAAVETTKARGGKVIAVGTTTVRALESASRRGRLEACEGETDLFITPGFHFACVDRLITNFHLPESSLLTLVCAFAGYEPVMAAYRHAVLQKYRFFSYGDAMYLSRAD